MFAHPAAYEFSCCFIFFFTFVASKHRNLSCCTAYSATDYNEYPSNPSNAAK